MKAYFAIPRNCLHNRIVSQSISSPYAPITSVTKSNVFKIGDFTIAGNNYDNGINYANENLYANGNNYAVSLLHFFE